MGSGWSAAKARRARSFSKPPEAGGSSDVKQWFRGLVVGEASARRDVDSFHTVHKDDVNIGRPASTTSTSLTSFSLSPNLVADVSTEGEARAGHKVADEVIGLDEPVKKLVERLEITYDSLAESEQEMFLDIATCFYGEPLKNIRKAWRVCSWGSPNSGWVNLVEKGLITTSNDSMGRVTIQMHEISRDWGCKRAGESRVCYRLVTKPQDWSFLEINPEVKVVKIVCDMGDTGRREVLRGFGKSKLCFFEGWGQYIHSGTVQRRFISFIEIEDLLGLSELLKHFSHLELLGLNFDHLPESFGQLKNLSHLELQGLHKLKQLPETFGQLTALNHLEISDCRVLRSLPKSFGELKALSRLVIAYCGSLQNLSEDFGQLKTLSHLELQDLHTLQQLPESFGQLTALNRLEIQGCGSLQNLPKGFGQLKTLSHLKLQGLRKLEQLPESFEQLTALNHLEIMDCRNLQSLPKGFGELKALSHLVIFECGSLQNLPEGFGQLTALNHLEISYCRSLQALPEGFGQLKALSHLQLLDLYNLQRLPESFGHLTALNHCVIRHCSSLRSLPKGFGELKSLSHLVIVDCSLQNLPEGFGQLKTLSHLALQDLPRLQQLRESFGQLTALNRLEIRRCGSLRSLPEAFGELKALRHLELHYCVNLQKLPKSFGELGSLNSLSIKNCEKLCTLPESVRLLVSLRELTLPTELKMSAKAFCPEVQEIAKFPDSSSWEDFEVESDLDEADSPGLPEGFGERKALSQSNPEVEGVKIVCDTEEPECHVSSATEQPTELVEEFIAEIKEGDVGGFFVSTKWLYNLEEHEKEVLMLALRTAGFSEVNQTSTTILYTKLDQYSADISNSTVCKDTSFAGYVTDPTRLTTKPVQAEIQSSVVDTDMKANKDSNLINLEGKEELTVPAEHLSTSMRFFLAALKEKGRRNYCVSTEWLSKLQDNEQKMLELICTENGYLKKYETSSTTYFQRIEDHVSTCNDTSKNADKEARRPVGTTTTSGEQKKRSDLPPIDDEDDIPSALRMTRPTQLHLKPDKTRCVPQILKVTCRPLPRSATGASTSSQGPTPPENCAGPRCGDSYVSLPLPNEDEKIATKVEQTFTRRHYTYRGERELIEEDVSLQVFAESTLSCCLRSDNDEMGVRVKFSKLKGQIKQVAGARILDLVLQSVRTNVDAGIYLGEFKTGLVELDLDFSPNLRRVDDGVWLARSEEGPSSAPPGSFDFELRCDVAKRRGTELQSSLLFYGPKSPVTVEGDIRFFGDEHCLKLVARFQLVTSYSEACGKTDRPFVRTVKATWPVDLDCVLNYQAKNSSRV